MVPLSLRPSCVKRKKTCTKKVHSRSFSLSVLTVTLNGLIYKSERGNTPSLMAILYFVKRKRFAGRRRSESPSLPVCGVNQLRGKRKLRKSKNRNQPQHNDNNEMGKRKKTTNLSKIAAICAQNVWEFIFLLDFSTIFRTSTENFLIKSLLNALYWINGQKLSLCGLWINNKH